MESAAQKLDRCRLEEMAHRDWHEPRVGAAMGGDSVYPGLFIDHNRQRQYLRDGDFRDTTAAAAEHQTGTGDLNGKRRGIFFSDVEKGMRFDEEHNQRPPYSIPMSNQNKHEKLMAQLSSLDSRILPHAKETSQFYSVADRLIEPQESLIAKIPKTEDYYSGAQAVECSKKQDARLREMGIVSAPDSYSSSSPANAEFDTCEMAKRYKLESKKVPGYFNNCPSSTTCDSRSRFTSRPEEMSVNDVDDLVAVSERSNDARRKSDGQITDARCNRYGKPTDAQSDRYIFDMDSPPSSNASDGSLEGAAADRQMLRNPAVHKLSNEDAFPVGRSRFQMMPSINTKAVGRSAPETSGAFSPRCHDPGSPGSRSSEGSSCGGDVCKTRWGAMRDTGSPYEALIDLTFKCGSIMISSGSGGVEENGGAGDVYDGDSDCSHGAAIVLSDEDLEKQLKMSDHYWRYGRGGTPGDGGGAGREEDCEDVLFDPRHRAFVSQLLGVYERFVKTSTNLNHHLAEQLQVSINYRFFDSFAIVV